MVQLIDLARLHLDEANPRHEPVSGERKLIAAVLGKEGAKTLRLAADIAAFGLSPIDIALVMANGDGTYTVLEGNRRLTSLKLLEDPSLAPDPSYEAKFRALKAAMKVPPITQLMCHEVADRAEAQHWLVLRHAGEAEGASVVDWDSEASTRFFGKSGTQTALALLIIDGLTAAHPANTKLVADLDKIRRGKPTTLGRLPKDGKVRALLGITEADPLTSSRMTSAELTDVWQHVAADIAAGTKTVSDLKRSDQMTAYLKPFLPAHLQTAAAAPSGPAATNPGPTAPGAPAPASLVTPAPAPPGTSPLAPVLPPPVKPKLPRLFEGVQINKLGHRVQKVLRETYDLNVDDFTNASAVMIRVTVELAVDQVFEARGWAKTVTSKGHTRDKTLEAKITECLAALDPSGKAMTFQKLRSTFTQKDGIFSVSTMNAFVHSPHSHPIPSELRTMALNFAPFLAALDSLVP